MLATLHVRLKPYNPQRGHVLRKYTFVPERLTIEEEKGWYKIPAEVANRLRGVRQVETNPYAPEAFDICTEAEARAIDRRERQQKERRGAHAPTTLTTQDLTRDLTERRRLQVSEETDPGDDEDEDQEWEDESVEPDEIEEPEWARAAPSAAPATTPAETESPVRERSKRLAIEAVQQQQPKRRGRPPGSGRRPAAPPVQG